MTATVVLTDLDLAGASDGRESVRAVSTSNNAVLNVKAGPSELLVPPHATAEISPKLRGGRALVVSLQLALVMGTNSFTTGLITIGIVDIAADLRLSPSLLFWPVLAYNLTSSPLLIPFGALADVAGPRTVSLLGCLGCGVFVIACGLSRTGYELIAFRCLHGAASALFLPTAMSIISNVLAGGKLRNLALASLGLGMTVGFGIGLVLGGVLLDTAGWRLGYFIPGGLQLVLFAVGLWTIPSPPKANVGGPGLGFVRQFVKQVDSVGALISCACIGLLSYVLAMVAEDVSTIKQPANIALLTLSLVLVPVLAAWMRLQELHNRPALIPSSMWKTTFTTICLVVTFACAEMQCMELLSSLFFQNVQELSALQTSLRLLPGLISSTMITMGTGYVVQKLTISWALGAASALAGIAPLLMAVINPSLPYWNEAFVAQIFYPLCVDFVWVVSSIVLSESFPARDQGLAGAVFNTIANLGQALGLALIAIITNSVSEGHADSGTGSSGEKNAQELLAGYRAGFWAAFASVLATAAIGAYGLRKVGTVGIKRD